MKQISKILKKAKQNNLAQQTEVKPNYRKKRPVVNMDFETFLKDIVNNSTPIIKSVNPSESFKFIDNQEEIIKQLYLYAVCDENCEYDLNKGICLMGSFGVGKSILMKAFLEIFNQDGKSKNVTIFNSTDLFNEIKNDNNKINDLRMRPLFIDDLGKEEPECLCFGSKIRPISDLLAERYSHGAINFFTSNYTFETLSKNYGMYIGDRLKQTVNFVSIVGDSLRS
jgi:DNA replication protein DnaC